MGKILLGPESLKEKYNWVIWIVSESRNRVNGANYHLAEALKRMGILVNNELTQGTKVKISDDGGLEISKRDANDAEVVSDDQRVKEIRDRINRVYGESRPKDRAYDQ